MKAHQVRNLIGKEVEWEFAHDYARGTCLVRSGIVISVIGRNVEIDAQGSRDWISLDRVSNLRQKTPNAQSHRTSRASGEGPVD